MFTENGSLDYKTMKENFPKGIKALGEWVLGNLKEFQKRMVEQMQGAGSVQIPDITPEIAERAVAVLLQSSIRSLYDFFDSHHIFLTIDYIFEEGWVIGLPGVEKNSFKTRIEAEADGFVRAFEILEGKL